MIRPYVIFSLHIRCSFHFRPPPPLVIFNDEGVRGLFPRDSLGLAANSYLGLRLLDGRHHRHLLRLHRRPPIQQRQTRRTYAASPIGRETGPS